MISTMFRRNATHLAALAGRIATTLRTLLGTAMAGKGARGRYRHVALKPQSARPACDGSGLRPVPVRIDSAPTRRR